MKVFNEHHTLGRRSWKKNSIYTLIFANKQTLLPFLRVSLRKKEVLSYENPVFRYTTHNKLNEREKSFNRGLTEILLQIYYLMAAIKAYCLLLTGQMITDSNTGYKIISDHGFWAGQNMQWTFIHKDARTLKPSRSIQSLP